MMTARAVEEGVGRIAEKTETGTIDDPPTDIPGVGPRRTVKRDRDTISDLCPKDGTVDRGRKLLNRRRGRGASSPAEHTERLR